MDLSFTRIERMRRTSVPAPLDYGRLIAGLAAAQACTRTAEAAARIATAPADAGKPVEALTTLFTAGFGWTDSVTALGGSFHPGMAQGAPAKTL